MQKYADLGREASANAITVRNDWAVVVDGAGAPKRALEMYDRTLRLISEHDQGADAARTDRRQSRQCTGSRSVDTRRRARLTSWSCGPPSSSRTSWPRCTVLQVSPRSPKGCMTARQPQQYLERMTAMLGHGIPAGTAPWKVRDFVQARLDMDAGRFDAALEKFTSALGNPKTSLGISALTAANPKPNCAAAMRPPPRTMQGWRWKMRRTMQGDLPYSYFTGLSWLTLGRAQLQLGQSAEARHAFENAELQLSNTVDDNHPALLEVRNLLSAESSVLG